MEMALQRILCHLLIPINDHKLLPSRVYIDCKFLHRPCFGCCCQMETLQILVLNQKQSPQHLMAVLFYFHQEKEMVIP